MKVLGRHVDIMLASITLIDLGGGIPSSLSRATRHGWGVDVWDLVFSCILTVSALALIWEWWRQRTHPVVEWAVRLAGATWLAGAIALAINHHVNGYVRAHYSLMGLGLALLHFSYAHRIESHKTWRLIES